MRIHIILHVQRFQKRSTRKVSEWIHLYKHSGKSRTHVKDSINKDKASQLVYKLSCQDCTTLYIGETSRSVAVRMKEHSRLTKRHPKNNDEQTKLSYSPSCPRNWTLRQPWDSVYVLANIQTPNNGSLATSRRHATWKGKPPIQRGI